MSKKRTHHISLADWIEQNGAEYVAQTLGVSHATVCHWRRGFVYPTVPKMRLIKEVTKGRVGYDQIIDGNHITYKRTEVINELKRN